MKRKSIFLLGTILAGAALVGGTFAAWAVTDNASPFSVNITPGTLDISDTKSVTLEWGTKGLVNIENLEMGVERGPYVVGLKATTSGDETFTGNLSAVLSTTSTAEDKLINHLTIDVYQGETKGETKLLSILSGTETGKSANKDIVVTSGQEYKVSFYITLDGGMTPVAYNLLKDQVVTLTVDWNKGSAIEVVTSNTLYFDTNLTNIGSPVYAYAWNSTTGESNKAWPGVQMSQVSGSIYATDIDTTFNKIIFNDNNGHQTPEAGETIVAATPYCYYDNTQSKFVWGAKPVIDEEVSYYLVGTLNEWTPSSAFLMQEHAGVINVPQALQETVGQATFSYTYKLEDVEIIEEQEVKIAGTNGYWYGEKSYEDGTANVKLGSGVYDIYFNATKQGNCYIYFDYQNVVIAKGGTPLDLANTKGDYDGVAKFASGFQAGDVISIKQGAVDYYFYHYDQTQDKDVKDGMTYTISEAGNYIFWVNAKHEIWVERVLSN